MILLAIAGLVLCGWLAVQALRSDPDNCQGCEQCRAHLQVGGQA